MDYLQWSDELNTGIDVIDGQHRRIVLYINQLHAICEETDNGEANEILIALVDYTLSHFTFEETLISDAGYENTQQHCKQHDAFRDRIYQLKDRAAQGENINAPLLEFLRAWLFEHILHEDGQYVPTVNAYLDSVASENNDNGVMAQVMRFFS